jgi:hypothetical protein
MANLLEIPKGFEIETFFGARRTAEMHRKVEMRAVACSARSGVNLAEGKRAHSNPKIT